MRRVFVLAGLSALVLVAVPSANAQTPTVTSVIGSADGLFVDLEVELDVVDNDVVDNEEVVAQQLFDLSFGPAPSVTLPPTGGSVSDEVVGVDESAGPIALIADLLTAASEGALGPDGFATAESTVADIFLGEVLPLEAEVGAQQNGRLAILVADLITATCSADLGGVAGSTTLADASVLGEALEVEPEPNTEFAVAIDGIEVSGTLNRQVENPDGSLSVTALVLGIDIEAQSLNVTGTIEIGPATCGVVEDVETPAEVIVPAQPVAVTPTFTG